MVARIELVAIFTFPSFSGLIVIEYLADRLPRVEVGLRALSQAFVLLLGLSWESAFMGAMEAIHKDSTDKKHNTLLTVGLSVILCAFVIPAWIVYILPHALHHGQSSGIEAIDAFAHDGDPELPCCSKCQGKIDIEDQPFVDDGGGLAIAGTAAQTPATEGARDEGIDLAESISLGEQKRPPLSHSGFAIQAQLAKKLRKSSSGQLVILTPEEYTLIVSDAVRHALARANSDPVLEECEVRADAEEGPYMRPHCGATPSWDSALDQARAAGRDKGAEASGGCGPLGGCQGRAVEGAAEEFHLAVEESDGGGVSPPQALRVVTLPMMGRRPSLESPFDMDGNILGPRAWVTDGLDAGFRPVGDQGC